MTPTSGAERFAYSWQQRRVIVPAARLLSRYYFRARSHHLAKVPEHQPVIYVAKHPRTVLYLETMVLGVLTFWDSTRPPFRVMEKQHTSLHKIPGLAWIRRHVGAIRATEQAALTALAQGESLLIFPGGSRELYGRPDTLHWGGRQGFARLAARGQVPVVPLAIIGADKQHPIRLALGPQHSLWLPLLPLPVRLDYWFGDPLMPPVATDRAGIAALARDAAAKTHALIQTGLAARRAAGKET